MIRIIILMVCFILAVQAPAHAGAAVAKAKGGGPKGPPMPQQLPPGYVMTPEGIKKVPEPPQEEEPTEPVEVKDIVGLDQLKESLQESSEAWELIINKEDKEVVVGEFIKQYADQGVTIQKPADYYVAMIDQMAVASADMLAMPFERVLQVAAVMEYDFGNGQNPDLLAQKILGPQVYEKNKQRLMAQSQPQGQMHQ
jgi:hypothetical protein